jgi:hypothetical protein
MAGKDCMIGGEREPQISQIFTDYKKGKEEKEKGWRK